jgi:tetratricopeptide (TPR) repeat protein
VAAAVEKSRIVDSSEVERIVSELDAFGALRADLAARAGAAPLPGARPVAERQLAGDAAREDAAEAVCAEAWLALVIGLERAARLGPPKLPAHFRRQRAAWDAAADVFGEARYARIGARLARWRAPASPTMPLVTELLWALEQPEAAGLTRLALVGTTALLALVPSDDVRSGYVLAQSARAVRTLGDSQGALERYRISGQLAQRHRNARLRDRSTLGTGATYNYIGNYPAARRSFLEILNRRASDPVFIAGAHQGMLGAAVVASDWDTAFAEAWHLLKARRSGHVDRAEVLTCIADLCYSVGRHRAATRAAEAAIRIATRPYQTVLALSFLVGVATRTQDVVSGERYSSLLRRHIGGAAGPYEDARALLCLAEFESVLGSQAAAMRDLASARAIAERYGYHEQRFGADRLEAVLTTVSGSGLDPAHISGSALSSVVLNAHTHEVIARMDSLGEHELLGVPADLSSTAPAGRDRGLSRHGDIWNVRTTEPSA